MHLSDLARLNPSERILIPGIFSISISGTPGKIAGLDEIQEMTMDGELKVVPGV